MSCNPKAMRHRYPSFQSNGRARARPKRERDTGLWVYMYQTNVVCSVRVWFTLPDTAKLVGGISEGEKALHVADNEKKDERDKTAPQNHQRHQAKSYTQVEIPHAENTFPLVALLNTLYLATIILTHVRVISSSHSTHMPSSGAINASAEAASVILLLNMTRRPRNKFFLE